MTTNNRRSFQARVCRACGLRFPVDQGSPLGSDCPHCGATTAFTDNPYATFGAPPGLARTGLRLEVLLDNVRSLTNVGSMFRTADGAGIAHMHLGGFTPTPRHPKLAKTALGAQEVVPWTHHGDAAAAAEALEREGATLWAVEGGPRSVSLFDPETPPPNGRLILVFGHEVSGVDPRIQDRCARVVHLPMMGIKDSLNVSVSLGIVAYTLRFAPPVGTG